MRTYWVEQRRFAPELAEEFKIGAAAPTDDGLAALLLKRKFSEEALRQCGLFFMREGAVFGLRRMLAPVTSTPSTIEVIDATAPAARGEAVAVQAAGFVPPVDARASFAASAAES